MRQNIWKIVLLIILLVFENGFLLAQKNTRRKQHTAVSCPELWWGIGHPFVAFKAYRISKETLQITRDVEKENVIGNDRKGGQLDAFKHAFWMGMLSNYMGEKKALKLGIAHEKANFRSFKRNLRKQRPDYHDRANQEMDIANNEYGAWLAAQYPDAEANEFKEIVIDHIQAGRLKIVKKNNRGEYLDENNAILSKENLKGRWENAKCLVPSDYIFGDEIYLNLH